MNNWKKKWKRLGVILSHWVPSTLLEGKPTSFNYWFNGSSGARLFAAILLQLTNGSETCPILIQLGQFSHDPIL